MFEGFGAGLTDEELSRREDQRLNLAYLDYQIDPPFPPLSFSN